MRLTGLKGMEPLRKWTPGGYWSFMAIKNSLRKSGFVRLSLRLAISIPNKFCETRLYTATSNSFIMRVKQDRMRRN